MRRKEREREARIRRATSVAGYLSAETYAKFGYEFPEKTTELVVVQCQICQKTFDKKFAYLYAIDSVRCSKCFHKTKLPPKHVKSWAERLLTVGGFSPEKTEERFGYRTPISGTKKIVVVCSCGNVKETRADTAFHNLQGRDYQCRACSAYARERDVRLDWKTILDGFVSFSAEYTEKTFGYRYPERGLQPVVVVCSCGKTHTEPATETTRKSHYICKECSARLHFPERREALLSKTREFWAQQKNRDWMAAIAKLDGPTRSNRIRELNKDAEFTAKRVAGWCAWSENDEPTKGEMDLLNFVRSLGFDAEKLHLGGKEIDVYVAARKIGFEHNGLFWHSERFREKNYHKEKTDYFMGKGIKVVQIWGESEWRDRRAQVESRIRSLLNLNQRRVFARNCEVVQLPKSLAAAFTEKHHVQGYKAAWLIEKAYGLALDGEVLACALFSKHHRNKKEVVLQRFCCADGVSIPGGLSRLSVRAKKDFDTTLTTWCDLRWATTDSYEKAGWTPILSLPPDYVYFDNKTKKLISKQSRKKGLVKTPEGMTESTHAKLDGLLKVYDCGKVKLTF